MTGRTIPVTRTDGSEVASEATLDNIRLKTDNLDIALSALRDALRVYSQALTFTENWNAALTASYQKVVTTTAATKALRMSCACNATAYDIEFQRVNAGDPAPSAGTAGMALLAGDDFPQGIPIGDIYARSATLQKLIVWSA